MLHVVTLPRSSMSWTTYCGGSSVLPLSKGKYPVPKQDGSLLGILFHTMSGVGGGVGVPVSSSGSVVASGTKTGVTEEAAVVAMIEMATEVIDGATAVSSEDLTWSTKIAFSRTCAELSETRASLTGSFGDVT